MPDPLRIEERVVDRENGATRNAEYRVDLELLEGSDHGLGAADPLGGELAAATGLSRGGRGRRACCPRLARRGLRPCGWCAHWEIL
ncbi:hypothetical protein Pd630_LPD03151 [Rhodococcus opacus PD630]|nr:hypothetical protein Pd630_LPD03151 [Rhodococcus opacus PD630]